MAMSKFSKSSAFCLLLCAKTPIPFVSMVKKMVKVDGPDADKSEWIKLEFLMDPDNPASKYSRQFAIFKDGCNSQRIASMHDFQYFFISRKYLPH
jgi:hypothetical protein